ncbi:MULTISPECIES: hypothetical protein [unclassified Sphingomonas]|uniref:hypothetical protein n=1 Tax=unclassified Sphingomonas TaxID=196159 RepID=UPI00082F3023|nr:MULTISPECIES: hypothetical protein [unclassified Sphingomonas]
MKRVLALLLLAGALAGLFGAQAAFAYGPGLAKAAVEKPTAMTGHDMAGMDCAEMMAPAKPQPPEQGPQPCKGMTLACIAQMGCTLPVVLESGPLPAVLGPVTPPLFLVSPATPLAGRSYGPEPEPPTFLS